MLGQALTLILALAIPLLVGGLGGIATTSGISTWYRSVRRPPWTPPNWVFAPAWTALYLLMGVASWLVWRAGWSDPPVPTALSLYGAQLILNFLWSLIFFGLRRPGWAMLDIALLWVLILLTLMQFQQVSTLAGVLMAPYLAWVTYAVSLNAGIWWLNRSTGRPSLPGR